MSDLTVEMVQRGRGPSTEEVARRRGIARDMRSARERLTSQTGLERAFDYELLRHYAQYRTGAGIPLGLFAIVLAVAASFWTGPLIPVVWAVGVILLVTLNTAMSLRFLRTDPQAIALPRWRRRFVIGEALQSLAWA
ncbi:sensor histidine kinase, partial [Methylobacterium hispanicum]